MLHFPKVVHVPHALNGLHSVDKQTSFYPKHTFELQHGSSEERTRVRVLPLKDQIMKHHCWVLTLIDCLVVVACLIRDAMFVCVLPHPSMVPSMTGTGISTVDHVLDRQISRWPHSFPLDVDTIYTRQRQEFLFKKKKNYLFWKILAQVMGYHRVSTLFCHET